MTLRGSRSGWKEKSYSSSVLWCGQPGEPRALAEAAVVADGQFLGEDQVEEVEVAILPSSARRVYSLMVPARWGRPSLPAVVRMRVLTSSLKTDPSCSGGW